MNICKLYWIRHPEHTDITTQGYVGITIDFDRRMSQHKNNQDKLPMLVKAKDKYGWDNLVKEVQFIASEEYCREIEKILRPTPYIGWNNAQGGGGAMAGNTPWNKDKTLTQEQMANHKPFTGTHSETTKTQMSINNTGKSNPRAKYIVLVSPEGIKELHFGTFKSRCEELGISPRHGYAVAKGNRKSFGYGYKAYYPTTDEINALI